MSSMEKLKDSRSCFITRWRVFYKCVQLVQGEIMLISTWMYDFNHHHPFHVLILKKTSHTSFCFFETSKLVSPQFLLFTLFCFREKNREKNPATNLNKFYLHAVAGFATHCIVRIAMARCTREAKFEAVRRHYIKIYQSNFLLCYIKFLRL